MLGHLSVVVLTTHKMGMSVFMSQIAVYESDHAAAGVVSASSSTKISLYFNNIVSIAWLAKAHEHQRMYYG